MTPKGDLRLAVVAPHIGATSETFVRKHMEELLPGRTAVIAITDAPPHGHWQVAAPTLVLNRLAPPPVSWPRRLLAAAARRFGQPPKGRDLRHDAIRDFLRVQRADLIMGEYLDFTHPYLEVARELDIPLYVQALGYDAASRLREPEWRERYRDYNGCAGVIVQSELMARRLAECGIEPARMHVIPCGVELPATPVAARAGAEVSCLCVTRMVGKKGPIYLLDTFRRAWEQEASLRLDYVGDGPLMPAVRQFVDAFGLGGVVRLHGSLPHERIRELMGEADIYVQHSVVDSETGDEEGLPVIVLEAMAMGLPVVSTRHAGIPEAVAQGESGLLVDEGDSRGMAGHLVELARSVDLRARFGRAGRRIVEARFSWERERAALLSLMGLAAVRG